MSYESQIEAKVCKAAMEMGVFNIKLHATGYPDRLFFIRGGVPLFIEFKRLGEVPRPSQLIIHERLKHAGYSVQTHDTVEGAVRSIMEACAVHDEGGKVVAGKKRRCALP